MRRNHRVRFRLSAGAFAAAVALSAIPAALAQSAPVPEWSLVTITTIKPDMRSDFDAWQKQISDAHRKAGVPYRAVLQTVMGDLFEYVSVSPLAHFADLDGPSPIERALGKDEAENLMRKGRAYVISAHRFASMARNDLSVRTQAQEPSQYGLAIALRLASGKAAEFDAWMKNDYIPAIKKGGVSNLWVSEDSFGGDPLGRVIVMPIKNLAEFDKGSPLVRALGQEGARQLIAKSAGIIESVHFSVERYRADLSYDTRTRPTQTTELK